MKRDPMAITLAFSPKARIRQAFNIIFHGRVLTYLPDEMIKQIIACRKEHAKQNRAAKLQSQQSNKKAVRVEGN